MVADQAVKAGATVWQGAEATAPLVEGGFVAGAMVRRGDTGATEAVRARYVVVADGANSRFGRALGTSRDRAYPLGMAIRGYFTSPLHDDPWIESHLDRATRRAITCPDAAGLPGRRRHGERRGRPAVDVRGWKDVTHHPSHGTFCDTAGQQWVCRPRPPRALTGGRLPTGGSVPRAGHVRRLRRCRGCESVQR
jgi:hypothetical protein